jgi:hypothetical protein
MISKNVFPIMVVLAVTTMGLFEIAPKYLLKVQKSMVVSASPLETEVHGLIGTLPLEKKEIFYKVMVGMSDYAKNAKRIRREHKTSEIVVEVMMNYKMENNPELDDLLNRKMVENGLNKDTNLADSWEKVSTIFGEMANAVKYSIEQSKGAK